MIRTMYAPEDQEVIDRYQQFIYHSIGYMIDDMLRYKQGYSMTAMDYKKIMQATLNDPYISQLRNNLENFIATRPYTALVIE